jgi:hypothetical protein
METQCSSRINIIRWRSRTTWGAQYLSSGITKIDLEFVPENLKSIILDELDREYRHQNRLKQTKAGDEKEKHTKVGFDNNRNIITLDGDDNSDLQKTEQMVRIFLSRGELRNM